MSFARPAEGFLRRGQRVEKAFAELAVRHGCSVRFATRMQDIDEHWDLAIADSEGEVLVDVKGMKSLERGSPSQDKWHWIELHGVRRTDPGWLYGGKADLIAFETEGDFVMIERERLIDLVERLVAKDTPRVGLALSAAYRLYSRPDRDDLMTLIETKHIREQAYAIWAK